MSTSDIERGLVARYLHRVLGRQDLPIRAARHMLFWMNERAEALSLALPPDIASTLGSYYSTGYKAGDFERAFHANRQDLLAMLDRAAAATPRPEPLATNVEALVLALNLPQPDPAWKFIGLIACATRFDLVTMLTSAVLECSSPLPRAIAALTGETTRVIEELLSPIGELVGSGLVQVRDGDFVAGHGGRYFIPPRVNANLDRTYCEFAEMRNALLGAPLASPVGVRDYDHCGADRDLMIAVLEGATREGASGVNILLYGPPGAGKTELAKVVAAEAGLALFGAGEEVFTQGESDRSARLADLVFAARLLREQPGTALLFDEMEDVAVHLIRRGGSKIYLNRLLETNPVPTLWTSNELGNIDPALLRRMTLAIELKRPPAAQRRRIIAQILKRNEVAVAAEEIEQLAQRIDATPAIIENAVRAARFAGGGAATIERAARGIVRAVSGVGTRLSSAIPAFDPALTRANQDLIALADQLVGGKARAFSLCLSGPPGTGKSSFARYLASRLGLEIRQKRASDILGMYVGQSERNIADAFEEARENGQFLVFDEADSLLLDRRDAMRSWEITQVNEMLTWMEDHPLPVAFTTNLMERIDTASLRRFTFHVRFGYLDRASLKRAWHVFFGIDEPPAEGLVFANLTPGDFAKARKQTEMLGSLGDVAAIVEQLADIARGKPDAKGALGFTT